MRRPLAAILAVAAFAPAAAQAAGFEVVGHRGARGLRPENTIAGFAEAVRVGATAVEADVVITHDRHVVVSHERRLRPLQCTGPYEGRLIRTITLAQLWRMDCGTRHADDSLSRTQVAVPGSHMPALSQILRLVRPSRRTRVIVELKLDPTLPRETFGTKAFADRVVATIRRERMVRRTTVQSFDWAGLRAVARLEPRLRLTALASTSTVYPHSPWLDGAYVRGDPFKGGLSGAVYRAGFDAVSPAAAQLTPELLYGAQSRGVEVIPYTVDSEARMRELIAMGVNGIVTDYPDRLRATARRMGVVIARR